VKKLQKRGVLVVQAVTSAAKGNRPNRYMIDYAVLRSVFDAKRSEVQHHAGCSPNGQGDSPPAGQALVRQTDENRGDLNRGNHHHRDKNPAVEKNSGILEGPKSREENQRLRKNTLGDDDEKPRRREPAETPEEEFRLRIKERHGENIDAQYVLAEVTRHLGRFELKDFLVVDEEVTTNPKALTNPIGHYVKLAQGMVKGAKEKARRAFNRIPNPPIHGEVIPQKCPKCVAAGEHYGHGVLLVANKEVYCPECNTPERFAEDQAAREARKAAWKEQQAGGDRCAA